MKVQTSEYCAVGHPDRLCDYAVSYILDRYLEHDPNARVALELQLKDANATLSGEVTSTYRYSHSELAEFVREAIRNVGYTDEYLGKWGEGNTISGSGVEVTVHVSQQSGDIAQGVNRDGWGDQGIFHGMAVNDRKHGYMPLDYWLAREIGTALYRSDWGGQDVKTQVTVINGTAVECVVAIPLDPVTEYDMRNLITSYVKMLAGDKCEVVINGTGRYVTHGPIGDCGTTGRKLVADFYGGNSKIGGGSPWGKDPTKADVSLNILARVKALDYLKEHGLDEVHCAICCCIGRAQIRVSFFDDKGELLDSRIEGDPPSHIIEQLGLRTPDYAERCKRGLFGFEEK